MTEPAPQRPQESLPLDSTAQLLSRITAQLDTQLSLVSLNGTRRPMHRTRHQPAPGAASPLAPAAPPWSPSRTAAGTRGRCTR
ncbi:hypothetical protein [Streptomyces sp. ITFR-6]|uniref:hypothetical protein n=1 Tax=Streptomyces sp. ITFR-6 TaxID=3075197 RepID=UPI0037D9AE3F